MKEETKKLSEEERKKKCQWCGKDKEDDARAVMLIHLAEQEMINPKEIRI